MDNRKAFVRGNILSGSLSGHWENIKINNGNISMDQEFGKYPRYEMNFGLIYICLK